VRTLDAWGIVALRCGSTKHPTGIPFSPAGVVFQSGATRASYDVVLQQQSGRGAPAGAK